MKTQKTVYLDEERQYIPTLGEKVILVEHYNTTTGESTFELLPDKGGVGGNMDRSIKKYHGWRGETNNTSTFAHGLRKVTKVEDVSYDSGYRYLVKVVVGKDLYPDWE